MSAGDKLEAAAKTFKAKAAEYGEKYDYVGNMMSGLFCDLKLETHTDYVRMHLFTMLCVKLSRYAVNFNKGGHKDSIHDLIVYAAMLEQTDEDCNVSTWNSNVIKQPQKKKGKK